MKELNQYQCEHCKRIYADKVEAARCENNHKITPKIIHKEYLSYSVDNTGYPSYVNLKFENDKVVKYKRCGGFVDA